MSREEPVLRQGLFDFTLRKLSLRLRRVWPTEFVWFIVTSVPGYCINVESKEVSIMMNHLILCDETNRRDVKVVNVVRNYKLHDIKAFSEFKLKMKTDGQLGSDCHIQFLLSTVELRPLSCVY